MRFGSLFSGVGGFDLGLERAGMECAWQVEIDKYRREVLERHWPDVRRYEDVRGVRGEVCAERKGEAVERRPAPEGAERTDGQGRLGTVGVRAEPAGRSEDAGRGITSSPVREPRSELLTPVNLICGGFPCQDLSVAGQRRGLSGERSGLFYELARIVDEVRPRWILIENVPGLLSSNAGRDFAVVLNTLDELGYGVAWRVLNSRYFGVPQNRRRVYIVGHPDPGRAASVLFEPEGVRRHPAPSRTARQDVARPLGASTTSGSGYRNDLDHETYVVAGAVSAKWRKGTGGPAGDEAYNLTVDEGWRRVIFAAEVDEDTDECPGCGGDYTDCPCPGPTMDDYEYRERDGQLWARPSAVAIRTAQTSANGIGYRNDLDHETYVVAGALEAADGHHGRSSPRGDGCDNIVGSAPRRLMPVECERLQAFPDGWTHGKDGPRYAAMGDAVTVNVIQWLGERIMMADAS